jgi:lipid A disaccharide synthetase
MLTHGQSMVDVIEHVSADLPEHIISYQTEDPTNTYDLIAAADLGLVYTTTVGMEMAMSGVPVIVWGIRTTKKKGLPRIPSHGQIL